MDETKTFTFEQKGYVLTVTCQNVEQRWTCQVELRFPAESHEPTLVVEEGAQYESAEEAYETAKRWAVHEIGPRL